MQCAGWQQHARGAVGGAPCIFFPDASSTIGNTRGGSPLPTLTDEYRPACHLAAACALSADATAAASPASSIAARDAAGGAEEEGAASIESAEVEGRRDHTGELVCVCFESREASRAGRREE